MLGMVWHCHWPLYSDRLESFHVFLVLVLVLVLGSHCIDWQISGQPSMLDTEKSFSGKILMGIEFFNVCEPRPLSPQDLRSPIWISPQIFDELNAVENEKNKNNLFEEKKTVLFHFMWILQIHLYLFKPTKPSTLGFSRISEVAKRRWVRKRHPSLCGEI